MRIAIRQECDSDDEAIKELTFAAFDGQPYSDGTEAEIPGRLRDAGALTLSLVAEQEGQLVGHVAFSPVTLSDGAKAWFGLGPVSVHPDHQRGGIGSALIREGLSQLQEAHAAGVVALGDPNYYRRFGFRSEPSLTFPGFPASHFMAISFTGEFPEATVRYHAAFG